VNINHINSSVDADAGTRVSGCEKVSSIQKSNGLPTLEKEKETSVSNKTSTCDFLNLHACLITVFYMYR
jgi:hypothetical protein